MSQIGDPLLKITLRLVYICTSHVHTLTVHELYILRYMQCIKTRCTVIIVILLYDDGNILKLKFFDTAQR